LIASYTVPPIYAAFVWWFSTGAVLLLVGRSGRFEVLRALLAAGLLAGSLGGLALTAADTSVSGAYTAFTCAAVVTLTSNGPNQIGLWTFAALWVLRQSAKINLFLGVPVTNDELMPDAVRFLKSFFARKQVSAFFPASVTLATAVLVILIQRIVEVAVTPFDIVGLTLVSTLFALGVVEHWFMLLPLPAITLWGWGIRSGLPPEDTTMEQERDTKLTNAPPNLVVLATVRPEAAPPRPAQAACARQRLEDQFRQSFREQHARDGLTTALNITEPAATINGRTS